EWIRIESTTVTTVIIILLPRECQKSVTSIASAKLLKLQLDGSDRIPEMLLVISEGCLKAITIAMYNGNMIVLRPRISRITTGQFVFCPILAFIITAPPSYWIYSSVPRILLRSR